MISFVFLMVLVPRLTESFVLPIEMKQLTKLARRRENAEFEAYLLPVPRHQETLSLQMTEIVDTGDQESSYDEDDDSIVQQKTAKVSLQKLRCDRIIIHPAYGRIGKQLADSPRYFGLSATSRPCMAETQITKVRAVRQ